MLLRSLKGKAKLNMGRKTGASTSPIPGRTGGGIGGFTLLRKLHRDGRGLQQSVGKRKVRIQGANSGKSVCRRNYAGSRPLQIHAFKTPDHREENTTSKRLLVHESFWRYLSRKLNGTQTLPSWVLEEASDIRKRRADYSLLELRIQRSKTKKEEGKKKREDP